MTERVVDVLEVVQVDEDEREAVPVPAGALDLVLELADERLVVQEPGELVVAGLVRELRGGAVEVGHDALGHEAVDRIVEAALDEQHVARPERGGAVGHEPPENPPQKQKFGHDLPRREAERLPLARVITGLRGERAPDPQALRPGLQELSRELGDERGHVAELAEPPEPLQRGKLVGLQPLLDDVHSKLPCAGLNGRGKLFQHGRRLARQCATKIGSRPSELEPLDFSAL